jgi:hypothetical protein
MPGDITMDNTILKKKLSTFRSSKGSMVGVPSEVLYELLKAWEVWSGKSKDFYQSLGINRKQGARLVGQAKKLSREGGFPAEEFKEIKLDGVVSAGCLGPCTGIELSWDQGKVIRFPQVEQLVDFLKKVA